MSGAHWASLLSLHFNEDNLFEVMHSGERYTPACLTLQGGLYSVLTHSLCIVFQEEGQATLK